MFPVANGMACFGMTFLQPLFIDDDFIEITLDQVNHRQEDELFPASVFIPSADMSKEARATSPKVDINPLESRFVRTSAY